MQSYWLYAQQDNAPHIEVLRSDDNVVREQLLSHSMRIPRTPAYSRASYANQPTYLGWRICEAGVGYISNVLLDDPAKLYIRFDSVSEMLVQASCAASLQMYTSAS